MANSIRLKPQKWVVADKHFGIFPKKITLYVSVTRPISWIRLGLIPGFGSFKGNKATFLFWGVLFLRSQEFRTCEIRKEGEDLTYDRIDLDVHHEWVTDYNAMKEQMQSHKKPTRRISNPSNENHDDLQEISKGDMRRTKRRISNPSSENHDDLQRISKGDIRHSMRRRKH